MRNTKQNAMKFMDHTRSSGTRRWPHVVGGYSWIPDMLVAYARKVGTVFDATKKGPAPVAVLRKRDKDSERLKEDTE